MSWTIHVRATHTEHSTIERILDACPALLGRDAQLNACQLSGDERVSKIHASVNVRDGRVVVRDEHSTNGTIVRGQPLEPNRWVDVGSADEEIALLIAGWTVYLRARQAVISATARGPSAPASKTVVEPVPFGASQSPTVLGSRESPGVLASLAKPVDHISGPAQAVRAALAALRQAVVAEVSTLPSGERAAFVRALCERYPEVRDDAVLDALLARLVAGYVPAVRPEAAAAAYAAVQELSRWYVDGDQPVSTAADIANFTGRLRTGIDELVLGVVRLIGGVDEYNDQMAVGAASAVYPRSPSEFARAVFDWRDEARDGAQIVRAAVLDIVVQQLGSFQATVRGVRELLTALDPQTIEAEWEHEIRTRGGWSRFLARWLRPAGVLRMYRVHHNNLASEEDAWFRVAFGRKFAEEYQAFARETRASNQAPRSPAPARLQGRAAPVQLPVAPPQRGTTVLAPPLVERPASGAQAVRTGTAVMDPVLKPQPAETSDSSDP